MYFPHIYTINKSTWEFRNIMNRLNTSNASKISIWFIPKSHGNPSDRSLTMNQIISKLNQNHIFHIIHISISLYILYIYVYIYISMYIIPYIKHMWFSHAPGADSHLSPSCRSRQVQELDGVHLQGPKRNAVTSAPRPWWSGGTCWLFPWHGTGRFTQKMTGITIW